MSNADLVQWLPSSLNIEQWRDLMETLEDEFNLYRQNNITPLEILFDFRQNVDSEALLDMAIAFGYFPDTSLDSSIAYLQKEVESIAHRKRYKTTYIGYEYIYKNVDYNGDIFIFFFEGNKLIRASNPANETNVEGLSALSVPYCWLAQRDFAEFFTGFIAYDQVPPWTYDITGSQYDAEFSKIATKHIAPEYCLNQLQTRDSVEYLMTNEYLEYLANGAEYNRRAIEVPHNGTQLTIFVDDSGELDSLSGDTDYSMPIIKMKAVSNPTYYAIAKEDIAKVKIGTGTQALPSSINPIASPTALVSPLYESIIYPDEVSDSLNFIYCQTVVGIQGVVDFVLSSVGTALISQTLDTVPIQKDSFIIKYSFSGTAYEIKADDSGTLTGTGISSGSINYTTGVISVTFSGTTDGAVTCTYAHNSLVKEDHADFEFREITEVGLFDDSDNLIAYATFPPIEYNDNRFHLSFQFCLKQP